jgi:hypothetical protein
MRRQLAAQLRHTAAQGPPPHACPHDVLIEQQPCARAAGLLHSTPRLRKARASAPYLSQRLHSVLQAALVQRLLQLRVAQRPTRGRGRQACARARRPHQLGFKLLGCTAAARDTRVGCGQQALRPVWTSKYELTRGTSTSGPQQAQRQSAPCTSTAACRSANPVEPHTQACAPPGAAPAASPVAPRRPLRRSRRPRCR